MESVIKQNLVPLFQFAGILFTGLLAGLFYGYDCSVVKGLANLDDRAYISAFQSINREIQTPYFFTSFMGCLLLLPLSCLLQFHGSNPTAFYCLLCATIVYFVGVFGVTVFFNVPLNERLNKFSLAGSRELEICTMRNLFEEAWNRYHKLRTVAAIVAFALTILSLLKQKATL